MNSRTNKQIENTLEALYRDSQGDYVKMARGMAKSMFRPIKPIDFKDAYLAISKSQGEDLKRLIIDKNFRHVVEFGTSFGISTLFLVQGLMATGGHVITTELIESKAKKAQANFERAGVADWIDLRVGDALETLKGHSAPIDLLLLDGWKDLYLPLFRMLEPNFHTGTVIYVDNADMKESQLFLKQVGQSPKYSLKRMDQGKVVMITAKTGA